MGGEGTVSGMIIALRNNAKMRLNRKHFFGRREYAHSGKHSDRPHPSHIEWSPEEKRLFQQKLKAEKRKDTLKIVLALVATLLAGGFLVYFILSYF